MVGDQVGTPTWAGSLAERPVGRGGDGPDLSGILHWTDAGVASWYDFAVAIQEEALALGLLEREVPVRPLRTDEYPTRAAAAAVQRARQAATSWVGARLPAVRTGAIESPPNACRRSPRA